MDKYEMKVSMDQIKELVQKKKYKQASDLSKTLNWHKVKDWSALSAAITAHENTGEIEEARDMAILAYNRNLGGKKLVYELTTLMIKLKQFEEADELFLEYEKMAPRDFDKYILYYELRKAEGAPSNELVEILEDYKNEELDEKYMYELAKLYSKTGRKKECIKACDDIAVLFQDGPYVIKALKMKQFHGAPLTEAQASKLDEAKARRADMEITREMLFAQQMTPQRYDDNKEAEINEMLDGTEAKRDTQNLNEMIDEVKAREALGEDVDYTEFETEYDENGVNRQLKRFILAQVAAAAEAEQKAKEEAAAGVLDDKEAAAGVLSDKEAAAADEADSAFDGDDGSDMSRGAGVEAGSDMSRGAGVEAGGDMSRGAGVEAGGETGRWAGAEAGSETGREAGVEAGGKTGARTYGDANDAGEVRTDTSEYGGLVSYVQDDAVNIDSDIAGDRADTFMPGTADSEATATVEAQGGELTHEQKIGAASASLKDLIANAKKNLNASYDKIVRENEQERLEQERAEAEKHIREREDAMQIGQVEIPGNNIYDTQNLQAEIARNLNAMYEQEDAQAQMLRPNPAPVPATEAETNDAQEETEEQIDGQMSLADWVENVREEKYGDKDTKEYSRSELNRMLERKEDNSAAYEKLLEQKRLARKNGDSQSGTQSSEEMFVDAKSDLELRTGKASQKLEEAVGHLKEAAAAAGSLDEQNVDYTVNASEQGSFVVENSADAGLPDGGKGAETDIESEAAEAVRREAASAVESISLDTARLDTVSEETLAEYVKADSGRPFSAPAAEVGGPEGSVAADATRGMSGALRDAAGYAAADASGVVSAGTEGAAAPRKVSAKPAAAHVKGAAELKLDSRISRYFKKYRDMPGIEEALAEYFAALPDELSQNTSRTGNILISGNASSDKYDLAKTIVKAINSLYPDNPKKIARTTGDSINYRGITKSMGRLRGTVLVIEGAGVIQPKRITELLDCMSADTDRMIVILEDADTEINMLLDFNPQLADWFNHRIVLKQYTVNEHVEFAKKYARRRSYEVDDDALLELYLRIDKLHSTEENVRQDDVKEIINRAIEHSEKRASRKLFKGIKKKHTENGDLIYLTEADFKG